MNLFNRIFKIALLGLITLILVIACEREKPFAIFMVGDSTMASYKTNRYPLTGWGQVLQSYFVEEVTIRNHASSGRSSKSFISEGRWKVVYDSLNAGDYVFIQFGHNDEKEHDTTRYAAANTLYKQNLAKFVEETRSKGANPILFTPIARRAFDENGGLVETHGEYPLAVIKLADSLGVPLVDMNRLTSDFLFRTGIEESKSIYCWVEPNDNYPEGKEDNTHLSDLGAHEYAWMTLEELSSKDPCIAKHLIK
jgi:lysophospholipase L1-like esterase